MAIGCSSIVVLISTEKNSSASMTHHHRRTDGLTSLQIGRLNGHHGLEPPGNPAGLEPEWQVTDEDAVAMLERLPAVGEANGLKS
jgi:hypothetical protein